MITDSVSMHSSKLWHIVKGSSQQSMGGWQRVRHGSATAAPRKRDQRDLATE